MTTLRTHGRALVINIIRRPDPALLLLRAHDLDCGHDRTFILADDVHFGRRPPYFPLHRALGYAVDRPLIIYGGIDLDRAMVRTLEIHRAKVLDEVRDLTPRIGPHVEPDVLKAILEGVKDVLRQDELYGNDPDEDNQEYQDMATVTRAAGWLVAAAARFLPRGHRGRYAAEFRSELWDLAQTRARRRDQLTHALSLLTGIGHLRAELRTPHRRKTTP
jgi:hypothetical protein